MTREPYPLALSITSAVMTSLGLAAAAWGIKWGSPPPPPPSGDALRAAWLYVHVMWMLTWLIVWPAAALRPAPSRHGDIPLSWQWAAILVGAIPAVGLAGFLANVSGPMIGIMLALQMGTSVLMAGILKLNERMPAPAGALAGLLAAAVTFGPVGAFLWTQFFPLAWRGWFLGVPLMTVAQAARQPTDAAGISPFLWGIAGLHGVLGMLLILAARAGEAQRKAPGMEVPRA